MVLRMKAGTMRVLATIPEVVTVNMTVAAGSLAPEPVEPVRIIRVCPRPAFPWTSIAALALVALALWSFAGWRDARRFKRQQAEEQMASHPSITTSETTLR